MILGGDWFRFCSPIELDYTNMCITVSLNGERVQLQALKSDIDCTLVTGPVLSSLIHQELHSIEEIFLIKGEKEESTIPSDLAPLLQEFEDVFTEPVGLPPSRGVEHHIQLQEDNIPKHQHPYKTTHNHKDTIEKIVSDMLKVGIIQHSRSPFASQLYW